MRPSTFTLMLPCGRTMLSGAPNGKVWPVFSCELAGIVDPRGIRVDGRRDDRVGHVAGDPAVDGSAAVGEGGERGLVQSVLAIRFTIVGGASPLKTPPAAAWPWIDVAANSPRRRALDRSPTG